MAYSHYRTRIRTWTWTQIPNPMGTLYYAEVFTLVQIWFWIPTWMVSALILGWISIPRTDLHPKLTTCQSGDQSPNLNQWEISAWYSNPCLRRDLSLDPAMWISHYGCLSLPDSDSQSNWVAWYYSKVFTLHRVLFRFLLSFTYIVTFWGKKPESELALNSAETLSDGGLEPIKLVGFRYFEVTYNCKTKRMSNHIDELDPVLSAQIWRLDSVQLGISPVQAAIVVIDSQPVRPTWTKWSEWKCQLKYKSSCS